MIASLLTAASAAPSAGGAPVDQLAVLAVVYGFGTAAVVWLARAHREGRTTVLARAASVTSFVFRAPGWVSLPVFIAAVSLLCTMGGGFWDIGYHIDHGRDPGPLGNPGHYPMLLGFFGTFAAAIVCFGLADEADAGPAWVRILPRWRVPVGGLLLLGCATFGLMALPLDDAWHRVFGQDVTLWSPTHFMLLGGGTMSVIAMAVLVAEGARARDGGRSAMDPRFAVDDLWTRLGKLWGGAQRVVLLGGMLVGLEAFLAEYDWGVPLYRAVWQPLLLAAFGAFVFSAARAWTGRAGAFGAWASYFVIRSLATLIPVLAGRSPAALPLLLAPAVCVELVALRVEPRSRPIAFGAVAGLLCGTVGFAGEYAWSQLVMPLPWNPALLPEGLPSAAIAGVAGGVLGSLLAAGLHAELPARRTARLAFLGAFAAFIAVGVNAGIRDLPHARAHVELTDVRAAPQREALATVHIQPLSAADGANWLYILAWQGGGDNQRVVDRLEQVGDGVYHSTEPLPLYGSWKSGLRLQNGRARGAVPLRLPADGALAGLGVAAPTSFGRDGAEERLREFAGAKLDAPASFTRPFLDDSLIVLRETKGDVAGWLWMASISVIALLYAGFITGIAVGVARMTRRRVSPVLRPVAGASRMPSTAPIGAS